MKIESRPGGKDIEAWQPDESLQVERLARELTRKVYCLTKKPGFAKDYGLKRQTRLPDGGQVWTSGQDRFAYRRKPNKLPDSTNQRFRFSVNLEPLNL